MFPQSRTHPHQSGQYPILVTQHGPVHDLHPEQINSNSPSNPVTDDLVTHAFINKTYHGHQMGQSRIHLSYGRRSLCRLCHNRPLWSSKPPHRSSTWRQIGRHSWRLTWSCQECSCRCDRLSSFSSSGLKEKNILFLMSTKSYYTRSWQLVLCNIHVFLTLKPQHTRNTDVLLLVVLWN